MDPLDLVAIGNISIDKIQIHGQGRAVVVPGGSVPAVLTAAAAYGARAGAVTKIGSDYPSEWLVDLMSRGVDLSGALSKKRSCRFELRYDSSGKLIDFKDIFSAEDVLTPKDIPDDYLSAKHFHLAAAHPSNQQKFMRSLPEKSSKSLTLWPAYKSDYTPSFIDDLKRLDILFCNNHEIKMITNEENMYDGIKIFSRDGPKTIVLTKGPNGASIYHNKKFYLYPALRTSNLDTTGCGDSFAGGFLAEYLKSENIEKAGWVGAAMASFTMSKVGSWFPSDIPQGRIDQRIESAKNSYEKGVRSKLTLMDYF